MNSSSVPDEKGLLVVILHGVGADAASIAPIASFFAERLPQAAFFVPDAPRVFDSAPSGRQWFSITGVTEANRFDRVRQARPELVNLIDRALQRRNLGWAQVAVVGFSQGAIMALSLLDLAEPPAAIVSLSGRLASDLGRNAAKSRVLLSHGTSDGVIPYNCSIRAHEQLVTAGIPSRLLPMPGQGHTIDGSQLHEAVRFLAETIAMR